VYAPGYVLEDRVLRPAMVVVAKGGEKQGAAPRKASDDAA
jgi:molecular chaperone GrpE